MDQAQKERQPVWAPSCSAARKSLKNTSSVVSQLTADGEDTESEVGKHERTKFKILWKVSNTNLAWNKCYCGDMQSSMEVYAVVHK